ncbi:3-methyladenine DNA glycosylase [Leucobacter sp. HY1910]
MNPYPAQLGEPEWRALEAAHAARADALTEAHRARKLRGETHPIEDFLWTYYSVKPRELRRWHPGVGVLLENAAPDRASWKHYRATGDALASAARAEFSEDTGEASATGETDSATAAHAEVDVAAYLERRAQTVDYVEKLLTATLAHTPRYGCFGLHEWAMVYRMTPEQLRHSALPLRIGHEATNAVVESHTIGCTHFDAFRFFTPEAAPLNTIEVSREAQHETEQSGCLHAGMDVYKWALKLGPIVPGELLLDAFVLARDIRELDMRASPYDVTGYFSATGDPLTPVPIETPDGKREYARQQRGFAARGDAIRNRLLDAIARTRTVRP